MADVNRIVFAFEKPLVQSWIRLVGKTIACHHQKVQNLMPHFLQQRNSASFNLKCFLSEAGEGLSAPSHRETVQMVGPQQGSRSLFPPPRDFFFPRGACSSPS